MPKSGVVKQVLSLYRVLLRAARARPSPEERAALESFSRSEFERHRQVKRSDTQRIEYLLRAGRRKADAVAAGSGFSLVSPPPPPTR
jgi:hypothetical protein